MALLKIIRDVSHRRKSLAQVMNKKRMPRDHTTPMLVAVLSIFLVAELPQGMLHVYIYSAWRSDGFVVFAQFCCEFPYLLCNESKIPYCLHADVPFLSTGSTLSKVPQRLASSAELIMSRHKPSGLTDLTRSEQLALTSHRVSATSMLIHATAKESTSKMYTGNLLSVDPPRSRVVSFDAHPATDLMARNSLEIHEIRLVVPNMNKSRVLLEYDVEDPSFLGEWHQRHRKQPSTSYQSDQMRNSVLMKYEATKQFNHPTRQRRRVWRSSCFSWICFVNSTVSNMRNLDVTEFLFSCK
uniref:Transmembrane protein n=1 Tax=Haemonchus contortus TaxID=6289 RepID=A0A7I4YWI8_HAECO